MVLNDAICSSASVAEGNLVQVFFRHQYFLPLGSAAVVLFSTECKFSKSIYNLLDEERKISFLSAI